jgi:hypothetical protein
LKIGDTFEAVARLGETYETRRDYVGRFVLLRIDGDVYACGLVGGVVRDKETGGEVATTGVTRRFRKDAAGLLREVTLPHHNFKGSNGFRQLPPQPCRKPPQNLHKTESEKEN